LQTRLLCHPRAPLEYCVMTIATALEFITAFAT
jgi:hypothetical protein